MKRVAVLWISLFVGLVSGAAQSAEWLVERATSGVSVSVDGRNWRSVETGEAIPNAHWVRTGPRARIVLAKGSERIMYRENTVAAISVSQPAGRKTKVTQHLGSVLLAVDKRATQHTSVVTPHLAAVVKGTVFEVTVGEGDSAVRVDRGLVEVRTDDRSVDVSSGQQATASRGTPGVRVEPATATSLRADGLVGRDLAAVVSNGRAGGIGGRSATENSNGRGGGRDNAGGNGNGRDNGAGRGNGNGRGNGRGNGNGGGS